MQGEIWKEILEIFKKINEEYSVDTELDFEDYEIPNIYLKQFLDYITNLQTIEREYSAVLSENAELQEENNKLKELCDKYEEEHNTTFEEWKKDIKANKKAIRQIEIILEIALEQDSENVNLIDRLRYVLNILQGVDKE